MAEAILPVLEIVQEHELGESSPDKRYNLQTSRIGLGTLAQIAAHADAIHRELDSRVLLSLLALLFVCHVGALFCPLWATFPRPKLPHVHGSSRRDGQRDSRARACGQR